MICPNCGIKIDDEATKCPTCGFELAEQEQDLKYVDADAQLVDDDKPKEKFFTKGKITGIVAVVMAIILCAMLVVPNILNMRYSSVISNYYKSITGSDYALMLSIYPDMLTDISGVAKEEFVKTAVDSAVQKYKTTCGDEYKLSYKIKDSKHSSDEIIIDKVEEIIDVTVEVTVSGNDVKKKYNEIITIVKIAGKWNLYNFSDAA